MKKKIMTVVAMLIIAIGLIAVGYSDCHYHREGYLLHTVFDNLVVVVDDCGNEWEMFTDGEAFIDGQRVRVLMFDNYTPTHIKDDKIISYKFQN